MAVYHTLLAVLLFVGCMTTLFFVMLGIHSCVTRICPCSEESRERYATVDDTL